MRHDPTRRATLFAAALLAMTTTAPAQDRPVTLRLASAFDEKT
jgi:hypothetical protein